MRAGGQRASRQVAAIVLVFALLAAAVAAAVAFAIFTARKSSPVTPLARVTPAVPFSSSFVRSGVPWTPADRSRLTSIVRTILGDEAFGPLTGVEILDPRSGRPLFERNSHLPLVPASTIKLLVVAAALRDLGPDFRFLTAVVTDGVVRGDRLDGSVWLVGSGDPDLSSASLRGAVHELRARGVRRVSGTVYADGSAFGPDAVNPTWAAEDLPYDYAAVTSAVSIDAGTVEVTVTPAADGGLASVTLDPQGAIDRVTGGIRTASRYAPNTVRIDADQSGGLLLSGQIPYGEPQKYRRSLAHPTNSAPATLRALLISGGIAVEGTAAVGRAPAGAVPVWQHRSEPLKDIIRRMAYESDNHAAEQLLRAVGQRFEGVGTLESGVAAARDLLRRLQAEDRGIVIADGSGLSEANRLTASALCGILRLLLRDDDAAANARLLPRMGMEGTVKTRELDDDARGRVLAKDGYIEGASSLAGYVLTAHHGVVVYAFVADDWRKGLDAVWNAEDRILSEIGRL